MRDKEGVERDVQEERGGTGGSGNTRGSGAVGGTELDLPSELVGL